MHHTSFVLLFLYYALVKALIKSLADDLINILRFYFWGAAKWAAHLHILESRHWRTSLEETHNCVQVQIQDLYGFSKFGLLCFSPSPSYSPYSLV
ncbi:hypothetical protein KP509_1Z010600 [Ceratopteris richardii]|nr:hypothetical protein KP509_1Z010600 [Ceratopteris richardii]